MNQFNPEIPPASRNPGGRAPLRYSTFLPFLIVLLTLIVSHTRDTAILYKRKMTLIRDNAHNAEPLQKAGKEAAFIDKLHDDLEKLSVTDPVAAKIYTDFFKITPKADAPDATPILPTNASTPGTPK